MCSLTILSCSSRLLLHSSGRLRSSGGLVSLEPIVHSIWSSVVTEAPRRSAPRRTARPRRRAPCAPPCPGRGSPQPRRRWRGKTALVPVPQCPCLFRVLSPLLLDFFH